LAKESPQAWLPLTPPMFHILLALADKDRHGYEIMREVDERSEGKVRLGPGTLYGSIKRMLNDGLIEELEERPDRELDDERAPAEPQLGALPVQVVDRPVDLGDGAGPHPATPVEHAVHGGLRQPGLHGDLANPVWVPHALILRGF